MEKAKKNRKKMNLHIRFILVLLAFLLETSLFILLCFALINFNVTGYYIVIPFIIIYVLDLVLSIFIANTKVGIDYKVSWLTVLLVLPFVGAILYLLFAHKMTTKRRLKQINNPIRKEIERLIPDDSNVIHELEEIDRDAASISKYIDFNSFNLYNESDLTYYASGEEGFPVILEELKKAKRFIFLEFFIIERGEMFDSIYEILKEKVKEGVKIIFIYDDFGTSMKIPTFFYKKVRKDGIECYSFNRISPTMNIRQNSRDHKKIIVIDGIVGFTGGANLADEYINKIQRFGYWKDNFIRIKGKAVDGLTMSFLISYGIVIRKLIDFKQYYYEANKDLIDYQIEDNKCFLQPFSDIPFDYEDISKTVYLKLINSAKDYIYLSTPYLVPDSDLITALCSASKSGVKVVIVTPGIPDKKMVFQVTRSYYAELMLAGITIVEYTPGFNHEKIIIVDDKRVLTGTCNFDFRSLYLHFENSVFIANSKEIEKMKSSFLKMVEVGTKQDMNHYVRASFFRRLYWSFLRIIAPLV